MEIKLETSGMHSPSRRKGNKTPRCNKNDVVYVDEHLEDMAHGGVDSKNDFYSLINGFSSDLEKDYDSINSNDSDDFKKEMCCKGRYTVSHFCHFGIH